MSRQQIVRDCALVAVVGLLFQAIWAWQLNLPTYMDGYYYTTNGGRLASGFGLTEQVIWQFLDNPTTLPVPSHSYWMPAPSFLAAFGYLFSNSFRAAQLPFWFLSGLLPIVTYAIAVQLSAKRWQALCAALLSATGGFYAGWMNQPATFAPFAWAGSLCLLMFLLALQPKAQRWRYWLLAGVLAGLAHLTRADGVLFLGVGLLLLAWRFGQDRQKHVLLNGGWLLVGYFVVMGGWLWRNWLVWQRPLSTAGTQTIFLTSYDDLFAYGRSFDLNHLLSWGVGNILESRLDGILVAVQTFLAVNSLIFLLPFVLWGWVVVAKKSNKLLPFTIYTIVLYTTMSLIFTFPGQRGGLFHSSIAIWPWCMALVPFGVAQATETIAKRLPHWKPERASIIFTALFVVVAFLMTTAVTISRQVEDVETAVYTTFAQTLPSDAVVMVGNPPKFYYHTGHGAISVPNESADTLIEAAKAYHVEYLILDANTPTPLIPVYEASQQLPQLELIQQENGYQLYHVSP